MLDEMIGARITRRRDDIVVTVFIHLERFSLFGVIHYILSILDPTQQKIRIVRLEFHANRDTAGHIGIYKNLDKKYDIFYLLIDKNQVRHYLA